MIWGKSALRRKPNLGLLLWEEQPGKVWSQRGISTASRSENIIQCMHSNLACREWLGHGCESLVLVQVENTAGHGTLLLFCPFHGIFEILVKSYPIFKARGARRDEWHQVLLCQGLPPLLLLLHSGTDSRSWHGPSWRTTLPSGLGTNEASGSCFHHKTLQRKEKERKRKRKRNYHRTGISSLLSH